MRFSSLIPTLQHSKDSLTSLHQGINQLFDNIWQRPSTTSFPSEQGFLNPKVDISDTEKEYVVTAELPGVEKKDISLEIQDRILTIKGHKQLNHQEKNKNYYLVERTYGTFSRSFELPQPAESQDVKAKFDNGVLTICIPKSVEAERHINKVTID